MGEFARFECGNTDRFREVCSVCVTEIERYKEYIKGIKMGGYGDRKGRDIGKSENIGKGKNEGANVRFSEIGEDSARNAALSTDPMETGSDESGANATGREF